LTAALQRDKARPTWERLSGTHPNQSEESVVMIKPEWGTKRTCPQTGVRFYDLGKDNPVTSPAGVQWYPEPILKSKQAMPFEAPKKPVAAAEEVDNDLSSEDLDIDEETEQSADDEVDLGGDDDLGVTKGDDEDEQ
jgi:uncharacterized protein (TIGR02300 family)